jgi:hypothetical protein
MPSPAAALGEPVDAGSVTAVERGISDSDATGDWASAKPTRAQRRVALVKYMVDMCCVLVFGWKY